MADHDIYLLSFYSDGSPNAVYFNDIGIPTYHCSISISLNDQVKWVLKTMESIQPHVLFADVSVAANIAAKWLKESGIIVINYHRSDDDYNWKKAEVFCSEGSRYQSSGVICVSKFLLQRLKERVNLMIPAWVVPSGVPVSDQIANHDNPDFRIIYAGRLFDKQKQVRLMVERFIHICHKHTDIKVSILGDGPEKVSCVQIVEQAGLDQRILFYDNLYEEAYHKKLAEHNVLVLLSDYEGTPGSVMDAMSCGVVPIVLRYNGVEELVHNYHNGLIVENRYDSFNQAIEILTADREKVKKLGKNARDHIIEYYSIHQSVHKINNVLSEIKPESENKLYFKAPSSITLPKEYSSRKRRSIKVQLGKLVRRFL